MKKSGIENQEKERFPLWMEEFIQKTRELRISFSKGELNSKCVISYLKDMALSFIKKREKGRDTFDESGYNEFILLLLQMQDLSRETIREILKIIWPLIIRLKIFGYLKTKVEKPIKEDESPEVTIRSEMQESITEVYDGDPEKMFADLKKSGIPDDVIEAMRKDESLNPPNRNDNP